MPPYEVTFSHDDGTYSTEIVESDPPLKGDTRTGTVVVEVERTVQVHRVVDLEDGQVETQLVDEPEPEDEEVVSEIGQDEPATGEGTESTVNELPPGGEPVQEQPSY